MKNIILTLSLVLLAGNAQANDALQGPLAAVQPAPAKATTKCLIHVVSNHPYCFSAGPGSGYLVNQGFQDSDPTANLNAGRCLERALEYANWCGDGNLIKTQGAAAYFTVDGIAVIHSYADTASQKTTLGDGASRGLRFKD